MREARFVHEFYKLKTFINIMEDKQKALDSISPLVSLLAKQADILIDEFDSLMELDTQEYNEICDSYNDFIEESVELNAEIGSLKRALKELEKTYKNYVESHPEKLKSQNVALSSELHRVKSEWVAPAVHSRLESKNIALEKKLESNKHVLDIPRVAGLNGLNCSLVRYEYPMKFRLVNDDFKFLNFDFHFEVRTNFAINVVVLVTEFFRPFYPECTELQDNWPSGYDELLEHYFMNSLSDVFPVHIKRYKAAKEMKLVDMGRLTEHEKNLVLNAGLQVVYDIVAHSTKHLMKSVPGASENDIASIRRKLMKELPKPVMHTPRKQFIA
jgi:hypothetical protein